MRLAVTVWNNRIAPVFDCAGTALVMDIQDGAVADERYVPLKSGDVGQRAAFLQDAGVDVLICGAASCEAQRALHDSNIAFHAFVAGDVSEVVAAWLRNELGSNAAYSMPGCSCARRRRGRRRGRCRGMSNREGL